MKEVEELTLEQIADLYATGVDYDPSAEETVEFFKIVQNKLHFPAHGRTAAQVIASRADAIQPNMGLTSFASQRPIKAEVTIAKNYLNENELKKLNTLVSAYFDAAEFWVQNCGSARSRAPRQSWGDGYSWLERMVPSVLHRAQDQPRNVWPPRVPGALPHSRPHARCSRASARSTR